MQTMFQRTPVAAALAGLALLLVSAGAYAADCPADKVGTNVTKPGPTAPSGVTDTLISSIDLSAWDQDCREINYGCGSSPYSRAE
jgi:hypothetical protein